MGFKLYNIDKQIHKKYFGDLRGSSVLKTLDDVNKKGYKNIRRKSKWANFHEARSELRKYRRKDEEAFREAGVRIGWSLAKVLYKESDAA